MITHRNALSVTPGGPPLRIYLSQDDADFKLIFDLYSTIGTFTVQSGSTVKLQGRHWDRTPFEVSGTISGTVVTIQGNKSLTNRPGDSVAELVITHGSKQLATANFFLMIESKA